MMRINAKRIRSVLTVLFLCFSLVGIGIPVPNVQAAGNTGTSTSYTWVKQKATKKTKKTTKKKTVKLKKSARKSYSTTKTKKSSKSSSKIKGSTKTVTKVDTTIKTTTKYKKKSKKAAVTITTTTVTTTTPYKKKKVASSSPSREPEKNAAYEPSYIRTLAPKADSCILDAFMEMEIKIHYRPTVLYDGMFDAGTRSITLKSLNRSRLDAVIYHELGHFFGWMAGNVDRNEEMKALYEAEKGNYTKANKAYVTKDQSEFFAECYSWYVVDRAWLQEHCPRTCQYIEKNLKKMVPDRVSSMKRIYGAYWKSIGY